MTMTECKDLNLDWLCMKTPPHIQHSKLLFDLLVTAGKKSKEMGEKLKCSRAVVDSHCFEEW